MRLMAVGGFVVLAGGAVYFFAGRSDPDVFAVPVDQAYAQVSTITPQTKAGIMSFSGPQSIAGNGKDKVVWTYNNRKCEIELAPAGAAQTKVAVICDRGMTDADTLASMTHHGFRNRVIEAVDAALTGRPYNSEKAAGETAYRWPNDGVAGVTVKKAAGDYNKMVGDAFKMEAEIHQMEREAASEADGFGSEAGDSGGSDY